MKTITEKKSKSGLLNRPESWVAERVALPGAFAILGFVNEEEILDRLVKETDAALKPYLHKNFENFHRIGRLIGQFRDGGCDDVLRSAVVFLHATLEDFLRSIAKDFLPIASEAVLNHIPLAGSNGNRSDKFTLGKLSAYRKMTVGELITASVDEYLQRETFNNVEDIVKLLQSLDFDLAPVRPFLASIEAMMKRRHQIVHRADRSPTNDLTKIDDATAWEWTNTAAKFISRIAVQVHAKNAMTSALGIVADMAKSRGINPATCGLKP